MNTIDEKIYDCITNFIKEHKYPPTVREIGERVGLKSSCSVSRHLTRMQINKIISYDEKSPRTIVVPGYAYIKLPKGITETQLQRFLEERKSNEEELAWVRSDI